MTDVESLETLATDVDWPDAYAGTVARSQLPEGSGRLADLAEWLAAAQGTPSPTLPVRPRAVVLATDLSGTAAWIADSAGVPARAVAEPADFITALAQGAALADAEADAGTDLLVISGADVDATAPALTGLITGAEPVALLPRGAAAVDTRDWIDRAEHLRTVRRRISALRALPDELLTVLGSAALAQATGLVMRAAARRTPLVLDGPLALAAALLCHDVQPRAGRWWRVADTSDDPVERRIVSEFGHPPVLDLGTAHADGTAGLLAVAVVRAAVALVPGSVPRDRPAPEHTA